MYNTADRYGGIARSFHWLTVFLVALAWLLGVFGEDLPKGTARNAGLAAHVFAGLAILLMLIGRLIWRVLDRAPTSTTSTSKTWLARWSAPASRTMHYLLYALLFAVPVCGIFLQFARGDALSLFGLVEIPSPWIKDRAFAGNIKEIHELLAHALISLAALHALAALVHHYVIHDRTMIRMLPPR